MNPENILERSFSIRMLLTIGDRPGMTKSQAIKLEEGNERTKFLRIQELIQAGLVSCDDTVRDHNSITLRLTPKGRIVADRLREALEVMEAKE